MTFLTALVNVSAVISFLACLQAFRDYRRRGGLSYPPGPRPLPIVGNLFDIPKQFPWLAYTNFSKAHGRLNFFFFGRSPFLMKVTGDILSFRIFGQVIVVLNTARVAKDLLEKRAAIYSDRPPIPICDM
jgi:hypothetical protein